MRIYNYIKRDVIIQAVKYTPDVKEDLLKLNIKVQSGDVLVVDTPDGAVNIYPFNYIIFQGNEVVKVIPKDVFELIYDRFDESKGKQFIRSIK